MRVDDCKRSARGRSRDVAMSPRSPRVSSLGNAQFAQTASPGAAGRGGIALALALTFAVLISTTTFLSRVASRTGLEPEHCGRVVERTMKALASQLCAESVQRLSDELPPTLGVWVEGAVFTGSAGLAPMLAAGLTLAHLATVFGTLAETLPEPVLAALRVELHEELAALLTPSEQDPLDASAWRARGR